MDFHQKHEPKSFRSCAPTYDIKALQEYLESDERKQVYLLSGPTGLGKTTTAKILSNWLAGGQRVEIIERNMANENTIDSIREVISDFRERTIIAEVRVFILDEPQRIQPKTQDILIKALDILPKDIYVIFCTTDPHMLKDTLRHRTHEIRFNVLSLLDQVDLVKRIIDKEQFTIGENTDTTANIISKSDAKKIVLNSEGSIRKLFDNIHTTITGGIVELPIIKEHAEKLVTAMNKGSWLTVHKAVKAIDDHEIIRQRTCYTLSAMMINTQDDEKVRKDRKSVV